jgi:small subunit ribosomal protein S2
MSDSSLLDMLKSGVHFGHQTSRWHPKMKPYIYTVRNGVYIIDLEKTAAAIQSAQKYIQELVAGGGTILFLGTKRQAKAIVKKAAEEAGMPYLVERWVGGLFTNFDQVSQMMRKLRTLKGQKARGEWEKYTKKEQLVFQEEVDRLEHIVGGVEQMTALPKAIFVVDTREESTAIREATRVGVPIIAIVDTNSSPEGVDHVIPANDDAVKSIQIICSYIVEACKRGREAQGASAAETKPSEEGTVTEAATS